MRGTPLLTLLAAIGSGLVAGVFFAFSSFVMPALARLPAHQGAAAMREINVSAIGLLFMAAFMGTSLASLALAGMAFVHRSEPGMALAIAGCLLYLLGSLAVTVAANVPLNDALAVDAATWPRYLVVWTAWNHVRTIASLVAFLLLVLSLVRQRAP